MDKRVISLLNGGLEEWKFDSDGGIGEMMDECGAYFGGLQILGWFNTVGYYALT
jgi:hypothetical protein